MTKVRQGSNQCRDHHTSHTYHNTAILSHIGYVARLNPFSTQSPLKKKLSQKNYRALWMTADWSRRTVPEKNQLRAPPKLGDTFHTERKSNFAKRLVTLPSKRKLKLFGVPDNIEVPCLWDMRCTLGCCVGKHTKQPPQHTKERGGRINPLQAQQTVVLESHSEAVCVLSAQRLKPLGATRKVRSFIFLRF